MRAFDFSPMPNQMISSGPSASLGTPFRPVIRGTSPRLTVGWTPKTRPVSVPSAPPQRRPIAASCTVAARWIWR